MTSNLFWCSYFLLLAIERILNLVSFICHLKAIFAIFAICSSIYFLELPFFVCNLPIFLQSLFWRRRSFDYYRFAIFKKPAVAARKELRGQIGTIIYFCSQFLAMHFPITIQFLLIIKSGKVIFAHICSRSRNIWLQTKIGDLHFLLIAQSPRSVNYGAVYTEPIICNRFSITFFSNFGLRWSFGSGSGGGNGERFCFNYNWTENILYLTMEIFWLSLS